jgi:outer membrane protein W
MSEKMKKILIMFLVFLAVESEAQYNGMKFSLSVNGVYTTGARIYLQPYASDEVVRNNFLPVEHIFNPSAELRYALSENILIGIGSEYMSTSETAGLVVLAQTSTMTIEVEEGFSFIPVDFTAYYLFPFSTQRFKFLIGGGAGYYIGSHIRKFGNAEVSTIERKFAYGVHVSLSMDYMFRDRISIRSEMKFRDPQFNIKSEYNRREVELNGRTIRILQESFDSKVNIDGVTFLFGAALHF